MVLLVDSAAVVHLNKRALGFPEIGRLHSNVLVAPVDRETKAAQAFSHAPDVLCGKLDAHPAELLPRDLALCDAIEFFHFDFCGKTVAVPAFGEHHIVAAHPLIARHEIDVAPVKRIADMEISCGIRWWRIYYELWFFRVPVEIKHGILPCIHPFFFDNVIIVFFREFHSSGSDYLHC
ncbi:Uncharacterised protein [uncultured archaeon]|nr:Uncharacterised protein [uncultured archaeon]